MSNLKFSIMISNHFIYISSCFIPQQISLIASDTLNLVEMDAL